MQFISIMKNSKGHILVLLAALLLCGIKAHGQDYPWLTHNNFMVEMRGHYGFFYHHHFEMERFNKHFGAFEASFYQNTYGKHEWEAVYNYPYIGFTYYHSNLGNFNEGYMKLGHVNALYPFINYPLNNNQDSQITFKLGLGIANITEPFDPSNNFYNYSIGSRWNATVNLSFEYRQKITQRLKSVLSLGLTHFSNGGTKQPNYGLNIISSALGLAYYLRDPRIYLTPGSRPDYYPFEFDNKRWLSFDLEYGVSFKNVAQTLGGVDDYYQVHEVTFHALGQFTRYSRAGIGLGASLDFSDERLENCKPLGNGELNITYKKKEKNNNGTWEYKEYTDKISIYQMTKLNFSFCYALSMSRLSYYFEFGWHLRYNPYTDLGKGKVFQKLSLKYRIYDNLYAHLSLTSHMARADFVTFGIGYSFNQKYYLNHEKGTRRHLPGMH